MAKSRNTTPTTEQRQGRSGLPPLVWQWPLLLLVGGVLGATIWDAVDPSGGTDTAADSPPATNTAPTNQPALPTTQQPTSGQPDAYGRLPGDPHYGHNHP